MRIRKIFLAAALLAASLLAATGSPARGENGHDLTLETPGGDSVSLGRLAGDKPVLLVFWATWCPICAEEVPKINEVQSRLSDRLRILAIDFLESGEKVRKFMKAKNVSYTVLLDRNGKAAQAYRVVGIPTYVILDRQGKVAYFGNELPPSIEKFL